MIKLHQLHEAIFEVEKHRVHRSHIVIFSPPYVVRACAGWDAPLGQCALLYDLPGEPIRFAGILIIEDECFNEVVVKSLISGHRIVVEDKMEVSHG